VSLYRIWRPQTFASLVGQDAVVATLSSALESGKLAHAYLFAGPRGSGKTSAAKILARCIDCVNGPTATPDNTCENCLAILSGTALDVLEIDAASNRGIDEIRALRDAVKFAPASMRMKVYIIDEAHMLTKEGANAFLKTLEEPPPHAVFILATTEPEKLPVTILSRCQRYSFKRIATPVMIGRMKEIATAEGIGIDEAALAAIAYRAEGGLRDALTMLEQAAAFASGELITAKTLDLAFGATGRQFAEILVDAAIARDAAAALNAIEAASDAGTDMNVLIRSLIAAFRNLLVARVDPALLARDLAPEDARSATERAKTVAQATIVRALRILSDAMSLARTGGNPRLEIETGLLRLILATEDATLDGLSARLAALEEGTPRVSAAPPLAHIPASPSQPAVASTTHNPVAPPAPVTQSARPDPPAQSEMPDSVTQSETPDPVTRSEGTDPVILSERSESKGEGRLAPTDRSGPISVQKVRAAWQSIRGKVEGERQSLRGPLSRAAIESVEGDAVVLRLPDKLSADMLSSHVKLIETAIVDVLGSALRVSLRFDAPAPSAGPARKKGSAPAPSQPPPPKDVHPAAGAGDEIDDADALFNYANERISKP
jgi:DNA polymerase III subunit gamma/tau